MNRVKHIWYNQFDKEDRKMAKITAFCWVAYAVMKYKKHIK